MNDEPHLTVADLSQLFEPAIDAAERVGVEVEVGLVDPGSGCSIPYERAKVLLDTAATEFGAEPICDGPSLVGLRLRDGATLTLETGGALEYSSAPSTTVAQAVNAVETALRHTAEIADRLRIALLSGGSVPFTTVDKIPWIPKPRVQAMRDYFTNLGEPGSFGDPVMGLILSTQTSLDYLTTADLFEKLRLHVLASPVVAGLFVNSPLDSGENSGVLSRRMQFWTKFDPRRCGVLGFALHPQATVTDIVQWAVDLPIIYRAWGNTHIAVQPERTFRQALNEGFGDGTWPTERDWEIHLGQFWPHVRPRRTLELRASDGPPWPYFSAVPAIWVGLTYNTQSRKKAIDLLAELTANDLNAATDAIAVKGLNASAGTWSVRELGIDLLKLARSGLAARVAEGLEQSATLGFLDPIEELVDQGDSFADRCLNRWYGDLNRSAARYVEAYRIRP